MLSILEEILGRHQAGDAVHLNDLEEAIGDNAVSYEEVEEMVDLLEAAGLRVGEPPDEGGVEIIKKVVAAARKLAMVSGTKPTVEAIGREAGLPSRVVRRALEDAGRVQKPQPKAN